MVFVYGTLKQGGKLAGAFDGNRTGSQRAVLKGALLYDLGAFPFMVEAPDGEVIGELHTYSPLYKVITRMDSIEGFDPSREESENFYLRKMVVVTGEDGKRYNAWAYFMNPEHVARLTVTRKPIESGEWLQEEHPDDHWDEEGDFADEQDDQECILEVGVLCHGCGDCERTIGRVKH